MTNEIIRDKKLKVFNLEGTGNFKLIETNNGIVITDIIASNINGRILFRMNDGRNEQDFLQLRKDSCLNFPNGLNFWTGANLELIKETNEQCIITIGYLLNDNPKDWDIWNL
jgi:hypothetical protein